MKKINKYHSVRIVPSLIGHSMVNFEPNCYLSSSVPKYKFRR